MVNLHYDRGTGHRLTQRERKAKPCYLWTGTQHRHAVPRKDPTAQGHHTSLPIILPRQYLTPKEES